MEKPAAYSNVVTRLDFDGCMKYMIDKGLMTESDTYVLWGCIGPIRDKTHVSTKTFYATEGLGVESVADLFGMFMKEFPTKVDQFWVDYHLEY